MHPLERLKLTVITRLKEFNSNVSLQTKNSIEIPKIAVMVIRRRAACKSITNHFSIMRPINFPPSVYWLRNAVQDQATFFRYLFNQQTIGLNAAQRQNATMAHHVNTRHSHSRRICCCICILSLHPRHSTGLDLPGEADGFEGLQQADYVAPAGGQLFRVFFALTLKDNQETIRVMKKKKVSHVKNNNQIIIIICV